MSLVPAVAGNGEGSWFAGDVDVLGGWEEGSVEGMKRELLDGSCRREPERSGVLAGEMGLYESGWTLADGGKRVA